MNAMLEQINAAGEAFVNFAGPMLVQVSVLILIILAVDLLLKKKVRAVFRYWLWMLVLAKLVLPVTLSSPFSLGYLIGDQLNAEVNVQEPAAELGFVLQEPLAVEGIDSVPIEAPEAVEAFGPASAAGVGQPVSAVAAVSPLRWEGVVFLVWAAVVVAMMLMLLQRAFFVFGLVAQASEAGGTMGDILERCKEKMGMRGKVGLKLSANATSPAVCGLFRPVILVPQDLEARLDGSEMRAVLMHELAHIRRGDLWVNLAQTVLQIVYFYNPLLWIANVIIRRVREQAVDEAVLVAMGDSARQYPRTLVNVAKLAFGRPALSLRLIGVVESKNALKGRVKRILEQPLPKSAKLGIAGLIMVLLFGSILLPMAKMDPGPPELVIKGVVTDTGTGEPIAGAKVFDDGYGPEPDWSKIQPDERGEWGAITNSAGQYSFLTWPEHHSIKAEVPGYKAKKESLYSGHFTLNKKDEEIFDFELTRDKAAEQSEFKASLAGGVTVELVGVCDYPDDKARCWRPDGSIQDRQIFVKRERDYIDGKYGFILKTTGPEDLSFAWNKIEGSEGYWGSCTVVDGKGHNLDDFEAAITKDGIELGATNIRVGVATGGWQTIAAHTGRSMGISNGISFTEAVETKVGVQIYTTDTLGRDVTQRIVAIDNEGTVHPWKVRTGSVSNSEIRQSIGTFPNLKLEQIKKFQFQTRPYEWLTFKNVSLRPNFKTNVQIEVEKPAVQVGGERATAEHKSNTSDEVVYKQLEEIVELSGLSTDMAFVEAIEEIKYSVDPPLRIVVMWRDLFENADVDQTTPINMDAMPAVRLGMALRLLLDSVSGFADLGFVVRDGVIIISTKESLPTILETRVYDISELVSKAEGAHHIDRLVIHTIAPESWQGGGGEGTVNVYQGKKLVVSQTHEVHREIRKLLQGLQTSPDAAAEVEGAITSPQILTSSYILSVPVDLPQLKGIISDDKSKAKMITPERLEEFLDIARNIPQARIISAPDLLTNDGEAGEIRTENAKGFEYVKLNIKNTVQPDGKTVRLELYCEYSVSVGQDVSSTSVSTTAAILSEHAIAVAGSIPLDGQTVLLLVKPQILERQFSKTGIVQTEKPAGGVEVEPVKKPNMLSKSPEAEPLVLLGMQLIDVTPELQKEYQLYHPFGVLILDPGFGHQRLDIGKLQKGYYFWMVGNKKINNMREMITEILRINAKPKPTEGGSIDEGHKGFVRVVYGYEKGTNTQYLRFTEEDAKELRGAGKAIGIPDDKLYYGKDKEIEARTESAKKLMELGNHMLIFANDHDEKYPENLDELLKDILVNEDDLAWLTRNIEYRGDKVKLVGPPNAILAYDKTLLMQKDSQGTNVLYNDSHVSFEKTETLKKLGIKTESSVGQIKEFKRQLDEAVSVDIDNSPGSDRLSVQYAVMAICEAAGVPYQWDKSAELADSQRRQYTEPVHIKDVPAKDVLADILRPVGLSYGLDEDGLYLYKVDSEVEGGST